MLKPFTNREGKGLKAPVTSSIEPILVKEKLPAVPNLLIPPDAEFVSCEEATNKGQ